MTTAQRSKSANKQTIGKKLMALMKKRYKTAPPSKILPVLETVVFAICLEDSTFEVAEADYERLWEEFHDLNEVRVSSISELANVMNGKEAERKALRIRSSLQYVFEKNYAFDYEILRRKTLDLAAKHLAKFKELSPFARLFTLQASLGGHLVPVDESMTAAAVWLGMVKVGATPAKAATELKSSVRKNDSLLFCHMLRCMAHDPRVKKTFERARSKPPEEDFDVSTAVERLTELFRTGTKIQRVKKKKKTTKKAIKRTGSQTKTKKKKSKVAAKKSSSTAKKRTKKVAKKAAAKKAGSTRKARKKK